MRKSFYATAILSALAACSIPMTSYAGDVTIKEKGDGYIVIESQDCGNAQQIVEDIFSKYL